MDRESLESEFENYSCFLRLEEEGLLWDMDSDGILLKMTDELDLLGAGKISESTLELVREGRGFLTQLLGPVVGPAAKELGGAISDPIRRMRIQREINWLETLGIAKEQIDLSGKEITGIKLKTLVQIKDYSSSEEDQTLKSLWAKLLASGATGFDVHPKYPEIIKQLHPNEGRILDFVYKTISNRELKFSFYSEISEDLEIEVSVVKNSIQYLTHFNLCYPLIRTFQEANTTKQALCDMGLTDDDFGEIRFTESQRPEGFYSICMKNEGNDLMSAIYSIENDNPNQPYDTSSQTFSN